ncbi:Fc.00g037970.m01.CDS01 [Cosmosporella sp. VM-42]
MSPIVAFICGATGTQGGAVARQLRAKGIEVHSLARDPSSKNAKALEAIGVKLWPGDYDNVEALKAATEGCTTVFLNIMPDLQDHTAEMRWAKNIIAAGNDAGAKHIVYSSGIAVSEPEKLKHWDPESFTALILRGKQAVEKATRESGYQYWTVLRPGNFMANYLEPLVRMYHGLVEEGVWTTALARDSVLPCVDTVTIGAFGSAAILDPERFHDQSIEYADEMLLVDEIMEKLSKATGRELKANYLSDEEIDAQKAGNPFIAGQLTARDMSQFVDLDQVRTWGIPLGTLDEFLVREKERVDETYNKSV